MESEVVSLLCDPDTRYEFELDGNSLRNTATGRVYPIRDGIPLFVSTLSGSNLKYQALYDRIAPGYDLAETLYRLLLRKPDFRSEIIAALEVAPGMRVLEVGVGTGANLRRLPRDIEFHGLDLSWGMLQKCRKNLKRWRRGAQLFQGEAGRLPFRAEVFDCVFHVGGINFFSENEDRHRRRNREDSSRELSEKSDCQIVLSPRYGSGEMPDRSRPRRDGRDPCAGDRRRQVVSAHFPQAGAGGALTGFRDSIPKKN
jgi:SAM-dependent methyltransferase